MYVETAIHVAATTPPGSPERRVVARWLAQRVEPTDRRSRKVRADILGQRPLWTLYVDHAWLEVARPADAALYAILHIMLAPEPHKVREYGSDALDCLELLGVNTAVFDVNLNLHATACKGA